MGSDLYHLSREIAQISHGPLCQMLKKVREALQDDDPKRWSALITEINKTLNNATIR